MKEIPASTLDKKQLEDTLKVFHEQFFKDSEPTLEMILAFDNEYQFVQANGGTIFLMMPTKVILERREKQA